MWIRQRGSAATKKCFEKLKDCPEEKKAAAGCRNNKQYCACTRKGEEKGSEADKEGRRYQRKKSARDGGSIRPTTQLGGLPKAEYRRSGTTIEAGAPENQDIVLTPRDKRLGSRYLDPWLPLHPIFSSA